MNERSCYINSSSLSSGQLADRSPKQVFKIEQLRKLRKPFREILSRYAVKRGATFQIVADGKCAVQSGILKHNAYLLFDFAAVFLNVFSAHENLPAVLFELTADYGNRRRFSRSVHAEKGEKLSLFHPQRQVGNGFHLSEGLAQMIYLNYVFHSSTFVKNVHFPTFVGKLSSVMNYISDSGVCQ